MTAAAPLPDPARPMAGGDAAAPPPDRVGLPGDDAAPPLLDGPMPPSGGEWADGLARWAAEERVEEAARRRAAQRRHGEADAAEVTMADLLKRGAEAARTILVDTVSGDRVRGRVVAAGTDFCIIDGTNGQAMVPTAAIAALAEAPGSGDPSGGDLPARDPFLFGAEAPGAFGEALTALAADRPLVQITAGGRHWRGRLISAGPDVVSVAVKTGGDGPATSHIAIAAIDQLVILDR